VFCRAADPLPGASLYRILDMEVGGLVSLLAVAVGILIVNYLVKKYG
jgi:hypothetical protein